MINHVLNTGKRGIPIITKTYVTLDDISKFWGDGIYHNHININAGKKEIIKYIRSHLYWQGRSSYNDWYPDTDGTIVLNEIFKKTDKRVRELFPELLTT